MALAVFQINQGRIVSENRELIFLNGVYQIRCLLNDFVYIGSTSQAGGFSKRFIKHLSELRMNRHHSWLLQRDWNRLSETGFVFEIIEVCDRQDCFEREQLYLDGNGVGTDNRSYNVSALANTAEAIRESALKKAVEYLAISPSGKVYQFRNINEFGGLHDLNPSNMVAVAKGKRRHTKGWLVFYVTPENIALSQSGISFDPVAHNLELRQKLRQAHLGKRPSPRAIENAIKATKGIPRSAEVKAKIAKANARRLFLATDPNGNSEKISNLSQFCRENGLAPQRMVRVAQGNLKQHRGWRCQYAD